MRCEDGDPFQLLLSRLVDLIADTGQDFINSNLIDPANAIFNGIRIPVVNHRPFPYSDRGNPIRRVCFPVSYDPNKCEGGPLTREEAARLAQCEDVSNGLEEMCYWARVTTAKHLNAYECTAPSYTHSLR